MGSSENDKIRLFVVNDEYIKSLKEVEPRVQNNYRENRLYCKTNLMTQTINKDFHYYLPLTSAKESQKSIHNASIFNLYGKNKEDHLGAVHINNMIPVPNQYVKEWSPKETTEEYMYLVLKQRNYIKKNEGKILEACKILYDAKLEKTDPVFFKNNRKEVMLYKNLMNDVEKLEQVSLEKSHEFEINQPFSEMEIS